MAYKKTLKRRYYKKRTAKPRLSKSLKTAVKQIVRNNAETRYFDYRVTAEQIINNQLSNASASYYADPCDIPLFSSAAATSMEGRTGNQIDIRRIRFAAKFKLNTAVEEQLRLRFIAIRVASNAGSAPSVGKITLNPTTVTTNYLEPIAPDTPYQILMDKKVVFIPPYSGGVFNKDVVLNLYTPSKQKRLVTYSDTSTTIDYTSVMKGLIRIYWFEDNGASTSTTTSIVSSQLRTYFKDV